MEDGVDQQPIGPPIPAHEVPHVLRDGSGVAWVEGAVPPSLVAELRTAVDAAVVADGDRLGEQSGRLHGRVLYCPAYGGAFLDVLALDDLFAPVDASLGERSIVYTMSTAAVPPRTTITSDAWHRDVSRHQEGVLQGVVVIVALDDLTESNGATEIQLGTRGRTEPDPAAPRVRWCAPAGSVCYLDPELWHRSRHNTTGDPRRTLLLLMIPPWVKQRLDPRDLVEHDEVAGHPEAVAYRLGLTTAPPRSYAEYLERGRQVGSAASSSSR